MLLDPALLLPAAGAALLAALGRTTAALVVVGVAAALTLARLAVGPPLDDRIRAVARATARGVTAAVLSVTYVVVVMPLRAFGRVTGAPQRTGGWHERPDHGGPDTSRAYGWSARPDRGSRRARWLRIVGIVAVIAVVDYGVGLAWDEATDDTTPRVTSVINISGRAVSSDPRAKDPAFDGARWPAHFFAALDSLRFQYWPYVLTRMTALRSADLNVDGWTRRSTQPDGATDAMPLVSFYGGSTMFGIGQRDGHTIASEIVRLASAAGIPVRAANHGMESFVNYQEALLFEHFAASDEHATFAVFYDGLNDVSAQRDPATFGQPTEIGASQLGQQLVDLTKNGAKGGPRLDPLAVPTAAPRASLWQTYLQHSVVAKVVRRARAEIDGDPAGATVSPATAVSSAAAASTPHQAPTAAPVSPGDIGRAAADVYRRGLDLIDPIAKQHGITPLYFWQPVSPQVDPDGASRVAEQALDHRATSIATCLDGHPDVYLTSDPSHTNEAGARLVAACLWSTLRPAVQRWYDRHR